MFGASLLCFYKKLMMDKFPPKILSVNFSPTLFSFGFLDLWRCCWEVVPKHWKWITMLCYVLSHKSADLAWWSGDAGLCLALHGLARHFV